MGLHTVTPADTSDPAAAAPAARTPLPAPPRNVEFSVSQLQIADSTPIITAIEQKRGRKLICLTYNDSPPALGLAPAVIPVLEVVLSEIGRTPGLDLLLRVTGGAVETPWRIVTLLREFTPDLGVIVSRVAFSAGTHIALAADDLVMGPLAALSPVDPTRLHGLLPRDRQGNPIPASVQDLKHCVRFIREQLGESYSQQNLALIVSELFKYVHPLALGALEQTHEAAALITRKVLNTRKNRLSEEHVERIMDKVLGGYFSHAFQISRGEIEADLGLPVTRPDDELLRLIADFEDQYLAEFRKRVPVGPSREHVLRVGGLLQSSASGWAIAHLLKADGAQVADPWLKFR